MTGKWTTTRKGWREASKKLFLQGKSRGPHTLSRDLNHSFGGDEEAGPSSSACLPTGQSVCTKCAPVLGKYKDTFFSLKRQGTEQKRAKSINPHPKRPYLQHYRDLNAQTNWLRANVFGSLGNYLYCSECIRNAFSISKKRLVRQRAMKQKESSEPIREMKKNEVEEQHLGEYVVMPDGCIDCFSTWWASLSHDSAVQVRYPHSWHALAGRISNSSKRAMQEDFLHFVDLNSQPNGRSSGSFGPTYYLLPKFATIQTPKKDAANYEERCQASLVGEFNRCQLECGKQTISNFSTSTWLKKHRPKTCHLPSQTGLLWQMRQNEGRHSQQANNSEPDAPKYPVFCGGAAASWIWNSNAGAPASGTQVLGP